MKITESSHPGHPIMRLKAERRIKLHVIKLHYDILGRDSLEPSELTVALLWEPDCVFEVQSSLKEVNCQNIPPMSQRVGVGVVD